MLYLYKNITPNTDDKHYCFNNPSVFINALTSNLVKSVSLDNYRINTNIIKIALDNTLTESIADMLTYAIDVHENNGTITYFRCYHVDRINIQSGYVILYCSVDLWASYFHKATFNNFVVTRCNRNVGKGILDEIKGTRGAPTRTYCATYGSLDGPSIANQLMTRNLVYIVFALKYNIAQNIAGAVDRVGLFAFNLQDLVQRLYNAQSDNDINKPYYAMVNPVELAMDVVSGIYGIVGRNMWGSATLNAVVIGAWFSDNIGAVEATNVTIKSKPNWNNFTDITIIPYEVALVEKTKTLTIVNDFNKQLYVGTMQNGLKLQRTTEATIDVTIKTIPSNDKLTIIAYQGDNQQDITDAFSVTLGTTDGDVTAEREALEVVKTSIKFFGAGLAIAKGGSAGGLAGVIALQGATSVVANDLERSGHIGNMISGGDGAIAYYRIATGNTGNPAGAIAFPITNPYVINGFDSVNDENANVRLYGAMFSELTTLTHVFTCSLMGTGSNNDTFIRANCSVDNIPNEASEYIKSKLQSGIYLVNLMQ